jgi:hypothetical protein
MLVAMLQNATHMLQKFFHMLQNLCVQFSEKGGDFNDVFFTVK